MDGVSHKMPPIDKTNNAKLIIHRKGTKETLSVMFNPEKYSIRKSNQFASHNIPGTNYPQIQFVSGESEILSVELLFDTYTYENSKDVRKEYTDKISGLLQIDDALHAPPVCTFAWGSHLFTGILESVERNFTMFDKDGIPVRATVSITLKQYKEQEKSKSIVDKTKRHIMKAGDTLWGMASQEYNDPAKWKLIASVNNIDDPLNISVGLELTIPPLNNDGN